MSSSSSESMAFATAQYYADRAGQSLSDFNAGQLGILLEEASALIRRNAPGIDERIGLPTSQGGVELVRVKGIACDIVFRYLANPSMASQIGDGPFTTAYASDARGLFLTPGEAAELNPAIETDTGRVPGVGSFRITTPVTPRQGCW